MVWRISANRFVNKVINVILSVFVVKAQQWVILIFFLT